MKTSLLKYVCLRNAFLLILAVLLYAGCGTSKINYGDGSFQVKKVKHLSAQIIKIKGNNLVLRVEKPVDLFKNSKKFAHSLALTIIENSYLLKGQSTKVNSHRALVSSISGDTITVALNTSSRQFNPGQDVKISLVKKTIAIKNFEVIVGKNKSVAKYIQEDVTTALVNSGQFNVVERSKLKTVLEELELNQSGVIDPDEAKKAGKLLSADVILTGTFAATGDKWNANLRMINTETGLITAAFNKIGILHDLKSESYRAINNIDGKFDDKNSSMDGWILGKRRGFITGKGGFQKIIVSKKGGAAGTMGCLSMKFRLGSTRISGKGFMRAQIRNNLKRDLNQYTGIAFYIKASDNFTVRFHLTDSERGNIKPESWFRNINVSKNWKLVKFPFHSLTLMKIMARKHGTDQILELSKVETLDWKIVEINTEPGTAGTIWLDQVNFYK